MRLFKMNEHWLMIERRPMAYATSFGITIVSLSMAWGFIQMPNEWKHEILPKLNEIEELKINQKNKDYFSESSINTRILKTRLDILENAIMPSCFKGRK